MATQSYYQNSPDDDLAAGRPPALNWLLGGAVISVVLLIGLPVKMMIDRDGTMATILRDQPDLDAQAQGIAFVAVIAYSAVLHAVDVALLIWFTIKVLRGRGWARIALTVYLVAVSILGLNSAVKGIEYLIVVILADLIHLVMLLLLWVPPSVRAFFAAHRAATARGRASEATAGGGG